MDRETDRKPSTSTESCPKLCTFLRCLYQSQLAALPCTPLKQRTELQSRIEEFERQFFPLVSAVPGCGRETVFQTICWILLRRASPRHPAITWARRTQKVSYRRPFESRQSVSTFLREPCRAGV